MRNRIISTICIWTLITLSITFFGSKVTPFAVAFFTCFTQIELNDILKKIGYNSSKLTIFFGSLFPIVTWFFTDLSQEFFVLSIFVLISSILVRKTSNIQKIEIFGDIFSFVCIAYPLHFFVIIVKSFESIQEDKTGLAIVLWSIATAKFSDIGGLLIGKLIGKHKMCPSISPSKTWEGFFGGVGFSAFFGTLIAFLLLKIELFPSQFNIKQILFMTIAFALVAVVSDLIESVLKRKAQIKDSGNIIPGIGGIFDLTDSIIFVAPISYFLIKYFY